MNAKHNKTKKKSLKQGTKSRNPSQQQLNSLREFYQRGRFNDAERLAVALTNQFPAHQFSWKMLGAILGQSGRIRESVFAKKEAVKLSPSDTEAHFNLGNTLKKLGILDEAKTSYELAINLEPSYAEAHVNLGATLQDLGKVEDAIASYKQALVGKPDLAEAHYNLGTALQKLARLDEAVSSYTTALSLVPEYPEALANLGSALRDLGRPSEAVARYTQAIALSPDYTEAHYNLGNTLKDLGRCDLAEASYKQAIALNPDYIAAHNNLGVAYQELGRLIEAEKSYKKTITLKPDYAEAQYNLGNTLKELGRLDEAKVKYNEAILLEPDYTDAHMGLLKCLYLLGNQSTFFDKLDYLINEKVVNATIGSLVSRSALRYGSQKSNLFCDEPLQYVSHINMSNQYNFEYIFVEKVKLILNENRILNRTQSLLLNGFQTCGNLFDIECSHIAGIKKAILLEIEKYRGCFKGSKDGLMKEWPAKYDLYGWIICMKNGGELKPHIHDNGWLSGSLYINVPQKLTVQSGNLVVSLGEETDIVDNRVNNKKIVNVVTGSLVLFPASLTHYSIPFEAEEERIVLAFDVKKIT